MARSLLYMKVLATGALSGFGSHGFGLRSNQGIQAMRGYSILAAKLELSVGSTGAEPKQGDDKGCRERSWMPDPVTGYYIPEDHFGDIDIAELRKNILKDHSATSRGGTN